MKATVHFDGGGQCPAQTVAAATVRYDDGRVVDVVRTFKPGEGFRVRPYRTHRCG